MWNTDATTTIIIPTVSDIIRFIISDKKEIRNRQFEPVYEISEYEFYFLESIYEKGWTLERALNVYGFEYKWIAFKLFTLELHETFILV